MKKLLVTVAILALTTGTASAAGLEQGWYLGGGVGWNHAEDADFSSAGVTNEVEFEEGALGNVALGYAWRNGLRSEFEASYRTNEVDSVSGAGAAGGSGDFNSWNAMANVYYDFKNDSRWVPYIGAGIGASWQEADGVATAFGTSIDEEDTKFAYQGMVGLDYWMNNRTAWGLRYNYFATEDGDFETPAGAAVDGEYENHALLVTLRYGLTAPEPAPVAPAAMAPAPMPAPMATTTTQQTSQVTYVNPTPQQVEASPYKIFFANNSSVINSDGKAVLADVANKARGGRIDVVHLTANTDTTGSAGLNERLSKARATAVRNGLIAQGISADHINVFSNAERDLPVPTGDGVIEPRNRVVTIVINN